ITIQTTPSPFKFIFELASTIAPALHKLNQKYPLFSPQYAANPSPIQPHPKSRNTTLSVSSLLSSIVSSPLSIHCPSCVQLLLNLCAAQGFDSADCKSVSQTSEWYSSPIPLIVRPQPSFAFSFPNPLTGQRINAAAVIPSTPIPRPWEAKVCCLLSYTTFDPFAPLDDDEEVQYDFDFDKRPAPQVQYDEGGGYGLVGGERRGLLPWALRRA
ncbi:hypothetical protein PFISCL1PPCAC_22508, partial [Pristionchus fissidentatus]